MQFKISDIASIIGGTIDGNKDGLLYSVGKIEDAKEGDLAFLANPKYESHIYSTKASAVLVALSFEPKKQVPTTLIRVKDPYSSFTMILDKYNKFKQSSKSGIESPSFIDEDVVQNEGLFVGRFSSISKGCILGKNVKISTNVFIGDNTTIGDNTVIHSGAKIYENTKIGNNCILQANVVIGSDGFGFAPQENGEYKAIPQIGSVQIEDDVSIGANSVIDCATLGYTLIKKGTKLDNLIQVAHNVEIGENNVIASQTGISGSSKIGNNCMIGGQVGISGHINIPSKTNIAAQSGILTPPKKEGQTIFGSPAINIKDFLKSYALFKKLPTLNKEISNLREKILSLELNREK